MAFIRVTIAVRGFTEAEARNGLPDLLDEFQQRPWLFRPGTVWDATRNCISITIDYEGRDIKLCGQAVLDEVWDCVIACMQSTSDIHFELEGSSFAPIS
ncbi:MAG: hypothetical protein WCD79_14090 [Chthoniobacteraceae bacterium]